MCKRIHKTHSCDVYIMASNTQNAHTHTIQHTHTHRHMCVVYMPHTSIRSYSLCNAMLCYAIPRYAMLSYTWAESAVWMVFYRYMVCIVYRTAIFSERRHMALRCFLHSLCFHCLASTSLTVRSFVRPPALSSTRLSVSLSVFAVRYWTAQKKA